MHLNGEKLGIAMDAVVKQYFKNLVITSKSQYMGHIDGESKYLQFIEDLRALGVTFATLWSQRSKIGQILFTQMKSHETSSTIPYTGKPFQVLKNTRLVCSKGGPCKLYDGPSNRAEPTSRKRKCTSKKVNCPAMMMVRCLKIYTDDRYRAKAPKYVGGSREIRRICKRLKHDLETFSFPPDGILRFLIVLSSEEEHNHTLLTSQLTGIIHPLLKEEIYNFVGNDVCSTRAVKAHLEEVVKDMFKNGDRPVPDRLNRTYYPNVRTIRFHMYQALNRVKTCKYDQEALELCMIAWQDEFPNDKFIFRSYDGNSACKDDDSCSLLFCHQTKWQQDLLARYGNDVSVLDAAYKTINFDLPLFFIIVKTNSGYAIVGTFVVRNDSKTLLSEALLQFKEWNPTWEPKYFLSRLSHEEISVLEEIFPECVVYISSFHTEQSWHKWLMVGGNVSKKAMVTLKEVWQAIASSQTELEYVENLNYLCDSKVHITNAKAQEYFSNEWLPVAHRWVSAYQDQDYLFKINVNNGINCQKKILRHNFLRNCKENTLTGLLGTIITTFLQNILLDYCVSNAVVHSVYGNEEDLPDFLRKWPIPLIGHVIMRYDKAKEYDSSCISSLEDGRFMVRSELDTEEFCCVDFQQVVCTCPDFYQWRLPCHHMCAVFMFTDLDYDKLPLSYRESPYLTVDPNYTAESDASERYLPCSPVINTSIINGQLNFTINNEEERGGSKEEGVVGSKEDENDSSKEDEPDSGNEDVPDSGNEEELITFPLDDPLEVVEPVVAMREYCKLVSDYSMLDYSPENAITIGNMAKYLKDTMQNLAKKSDNNAMFASEVLNSSMKNEVKGILCLPDTQQVDNVINVPGNFEIQETVVKPGNVSVVKVPLNIQKVKLRSPPMKVKPLRTPVTVKMIKTANPRRSILKPVAAPTSAPVNASDEVLTLQVMNAPSMPLIKGRNLPEDAQVVKGSVLKNIQDVKRRKPVIVPTSFLEERSVNTRADVQVLQPVALPVTMQTVGVVNTPANVHIESSVNELVQQNQVQIANIKRLYSALPKRDTSKSKVKCVSPPRILAQWQQSDASQVQFVQTSDGTIVFEIP